MRSNPLPPALLVAFPSITPDVHPTTASTTTTRHPWHITGTPLFPIKDNITDALPLTGPVQLSPLNHYLSYSTAIYHHRIVVIHHHRHQLTPLSAPPALLAGTTTSAAARPGSSSNQQQACQQHHAPLFQATAGHHHHRPATPFPLITTHHHHPTAITTTTTTTIPLLLPAAALQRQTRHQLPIFCYPAAECYSYLIYAACCINADFPPIAIPAIDISFVFRAFHHPNHHSLTSGRSPTNRQPSSGTTIIAPPPPADHRCRSLPLHINIHAVIVTIRRAPAIYIICCARCATTSILPIILPFGTVIHLDA